MNYILLTNPHSGKELLINLTKVVAVEEGTNSTKIWTDMRSFEVKESLSEIINIIEQMTHYPSSIQQLMS